MNETIRDLARIRWPAIPVAAFAAGTVFLLINIVLTPTVLDADATLFPRYVGAMLMGTDALLEDDTTTLVVGVVLHYALSVLFTIVIAVVIHRWGLLIGVVGGAIMGLALYGVNLYTLTVFFEWFFAIESEVLLLGHVLFGATAGAVYELLDYYDTAFNLEVNHETG